MTADDQSIIRGVVNCDYCTTALRVTDAGIKAYKEQVLERLPPNNIRVDRKHSGLRIYIPVFHQKRRLAGRPIGVWRWIPPATALFIMLIAIVISAISYLVIPEVGIALSLILFPLATVFGEGPF